MMRAVSAFGIVAVLVVGLYALPGAASSADLASWGGLPCNTHNTTNPTCPGTCGATYVNYFGGDPLKFICAEYQDTNPCAPAGCTGTVQRVECDGDCT
jgi:hypothetical protein